MINFKNFLLEGRQSSLEGNDEILRTVYDLRKQGKSEYSIFNTLRKVYKKNYTPITIFNGADHPNSIEKYKDEYHPPNSWHPSFTNFTIARIHRERQNGRTDYEIANSLTRDLGRSISTDKIKYNADHPHAIELANSDSFKEKHGIGYEPKVTKPRPKKIVIPKEDKRPRVIRQDDFHNNVLHLIHNEGLTNKQISNKLNVTKGVLLGYMFRKNIVNPNRDVLGPKRKKDV